MLQLKGIKKNYKVGDSYVKALKGVDIEFRKNEFVSILGPSGCGKTTMLNLIGGLDKYTEGDLLVNGKSTRMFKDKEWDYYRNSTIGFVFQSYNLISHQTVLDNVSIAMTLSGVGIEERKQRATEALNKVGLHDQLHKKPNQLSGGQMQRVAIARALVNGPKILLADEPTGALDSSTSLQVMNILKEISKEMLVIMVTHNNDLAERYSDRIVRILDGEIIDDTKPVFNEAIKDEGEKLVNRKTSMSYLTALKLSFKNLMTKMKRTIITALAGSIGIIGIALVLAIRSGMTDFVTDMQSDSLAGFPITIDRTPISIQRPAQGNWTAFPTREELYFMMNPTPRTNIFSDELFAHIENMNSDWYNAISFTQGINMNVTARGHDGVFRRISTATGSGFSNALFQEMPNNNDFILNQYDILNGRLPEEANEMVLIVDRYNRIEERLLTALGFDRQDQTTFSFNDFMGHSIRVIHNDDFYAPNGDLFNSSNVFNQAMWDSSRSHEITVVGIIRVKESASSEMLSRGFGFTRALTEKVLAEAKTSQIVEAQLTRPTVDIFTGNPLPAASFQNRMQQLGGDHTPIGIQIFPRSFEAKEEIKLHLDAFNEMQTFEELRIVYTDLAEMITNMVSTLIDTIAIVLSAFALLSLVVSSIMIGIITYVSVIERTKEIGILRAIGARKKDISRVFNAETIIIGFVAGSLGIAIALILSIPINIIVHSLSGVRNISSLPIWQAIVLVLVSMTLTFSSGLIPSRIAAKKDPVVALRTE
ncbi:MAG: ATP-binding cassette domain-containing protein [Erysipelotrichales bacterium]|nr:ATP-binding cassette domain-containing protein [Erysipelotrichales bacterium]